MNTQIIGIICILVLAYIYWYNFKVYTEIMLNGESYSVLNGSVDAALRLEDMHTTLVKFLGILRAKYGVGVTKEEYEKTKPQDNQALVADHTIESIVSAMLTNYNPEMVYENNPDNMSGTTSYTVAKGKSMYVCLRNKDNSFVDRNTMLFVLLHELSHIGAYWTFGHTNDFWKVFRFVLEEAIEAKIYKYTDYRKHPVQYCGMNIKSTPLDMLL